MDANGSMDALMLDLVIEVERAMRQHDEFLKTGVSTASHGGSHDTCFPAILRKHRVTCAPTPQQEPQANSSKTSNGSDALSLAVRFHEIYERLAPSFGYETRPDTRAFDPASKNGRLMVAVCGEILSAAPPAPAPRDDEGEPTVLRGLGAILDAWNALPDKLRLDPHLCKLFDAVRGCREVDSPPAPAPAAVQPVALDGLLGVVRTAKAQALRVIAGDEAPDDLRQTRRDLPQTIDCIEHAVARLAAHPPAAPAEPQKPVAQPSEAQERAAFEAWAADQKIALNRHYHSYAGTSAAWCWDAWQARAALAPPAAQAATPVAGDSTKTEK